MNETTVSIIIPVYNAEPHLHDTLTSIRSQTFQDWECICVDDGSTDQSHEIASKLALEDARFRIYHRPGHLPKGGNSCRNYGFELSRGEYIQWFDADDLMRPGMIERKAVRLSTNARLDFVVSKVAELTGDQLNYVAYQMDSENRLEDFLSYKIYFLTPGPMFRRKFLAGKPLFSTSLKRHQEWEFFSRLIINGCNYQVLDVYCSIRRMHSNSINAVYQKKAGLDRAYIKLYTVDVLNKNTNSKAVRVLHRVFHRYMIWGVLQSLRRMRLKRMLFFMRMLVEFSLKSVFSKSPGRRESNNNTIDKSADPRGLKM